MSKLKAASKAVAGALAALIAVVAAAKEAVGKSELATEKQIARILDLINASNEVHAEQVAAVKDRLALVEGAHTGSTTQQGRMAQERNLVLAVIVAVVVIAGTVVSIVVAIR